MSELINLDNSDSSFITANVTNSHTEAVAFEMKFAKDITVSQLKVRIHTYMYVGCVFYASN